MNMNRIRERKAISGAIMALILIGIAVVAGVVVFTSFTQSSGAAGVRNQFTIDGLTVTNPTGNDVDASNNGNTDTGDEDSLMVVANIKNTGVKTISEVEFELMVTAANGNAHTTSGGNVLATGVTIPPGGTARAEHHFDEDDTVSTNQNIDEEVDLFVGEQIPIHVIVTFTDGSTADITTKAIIQ